MIVGDEIYYNLIATRLLGNVAVLLEVSMKGILLGQNQVTKVVWLNLRQ